MGFDMSMQVLAGGVDINPENIVGKTQTNGTGYMVIYTNRAAQQTAGIIAQYCPNTDQLSV